MSGVAFEPAFGDFAGFEVWRSAEGEPYERIGAGVRSLEKGFWEYLDLSPRSGQTHAYRIEGHTLDGDIVPFGPVVIGNLRGRNVTLGRVHPFPARETLAVPFSLPERQRMRLELYDPRGRLVRVLIDEVREPGEHLVAWDGRDGAGTRVGSGVYFARLSWAGGSIVTRAALVR